MALAGLLFIGIGDAALIATGFTNSGTLSTLLLAASCFWLTSYVLINVTVLVLRYRYPGHPSRNKKLVFFGIPQILAILGDIYMIANIAEGAARLTIYKMYFVILAVLLVYAVVWMKFIKKQPLFIPATLEDVNTPEKQGSSKGLTVPA